MSSMVSEHFRPHLLTANQAYHVSGVHLSGFLAVTGGTITIVDDQPFPNPGSTATLVQSFPVTAGTYTPIPLLFRTSTGGTVTLGGGASGTLFI